MNKYFREEKRILKSLADILHETEGVIIFVGWQHIITEKETSQNMKEIFNIKMMAASTRGLSFCSKPKSSQKDRLKFWLYENF